MAALDFSLAEVSLGLRRHSHASPASSHAVSRLGEEAISGINQIVISSKCPCSMVVKPVGAY